MRRRIVLHLVVTFAVLCHYPLFTISASSDVPDAGKAAKTSTVASSNCGDGQIAFAATYSATNITTSKSQIYIMNADGSNRRRFTYDNASDKHPTWSPDGKRIAFESNRDGGYYEIYSINVDYSEQRRITHAGNFTDSLSPSWSPDGQYLAFSSDRSQKTNSGTDIYWIRADGSNEQKLTQVGADQWYEFPTWSPDGKQIAFRVRQANPFTTDVFVMNVDGSDVHPLTGGYGASDPAWSPDGQHIAFDSSSDGQIHVMNADGSNIRRLTSIGLNAYPAWSPDSQCVVFASTRDSHPDFHLYVMDADGSNQRPLTGSASSKFNEFHPSWSPRRAAS